MTASYTPPYRISTFKRGKNMISNFSLPDGIRGAEYE